MQRPVFSNATVGKFGWLLVVWAFFLVLGGALGASLPFVLLLIGSILYLLF